MYPTLMKFIGFSVIHNIPTYTVDNSLFFTYNTFLYTAVMMFDTVYRIIIKCNRNFLWGFRKLHNWRISTKQPSFLLDGIIWRASAS